jgi:hypothetical protein
MPEPGLALPEENTLCQPLLKGASQEHEFCQHLAPVGITQNARRVDDPKITFPHFINIVPASFFGEKMPHAFKG